MNIITTPSQRSEPMRIAICDDESIHRDILMKTLIASKALPEGTALLEYPDGSTLLNDHKQHPFDMIFMDIEMEGISGLEAGQRIRDIDSTVIMIFLTGYAKYVFKSFRIEPFDYIVKPINQRKIDDVLDRAVRKKDGTQGELLRNRKRFAKLYIYQADKFALHVNEPVDKECHV
jgi:DNA-binding LytR/AlgR family response regulator